MTSLQATSPLQGLSVPAGAPALQVAEGNAEVAFARLEQLYAQLPEMEEVGDLLARARAAAEIDELSRKADYRAAELAEADARVTDAQVVLNAAEAEVRESTVGEANGADAEGCMGTGYLADLRLALMAAGTQRGLRVGPAQNAERALREALERSPFAAVEEAREALLPQAKLEELSQKVAAYQRAYAATLAECQQYEAS